MVRLPDEPVSKIEKWGGVTTGLDGFLARPPVRRLLFQNPTHDRFRCQIHAPVQRRRHDLARRQTGEFLAVGHRRHRFTYVGAELVGRRQACVRGAAVGNDTGPRCLQA